MDRPSKKAKHAIHTAQLTIPQPPPPPPPPPPGPPVDPDVCTEWELVKSSTSAALPTLGLWGPTGLLQSTYSRQQDVNDDFSEAKQPSNQVGPAYNLMHSDSFNVAPDPNRAVLEGS